MAYDCIIVGGGPAGSTLAAKLAKSADVLLLEEHTEVGRPVQCAGIISPRSVEMAGYPRERCGDLARAVIRGPGGASVTIKGDPPRALVVDRSDFDLFLWERAEDLGATCLNGVSYMRHREDADGVTVTTSREEVRGKLLIGADGVSSKVAKTAGLPAIKTLMPTLGVDVPGRLDIGGDVRIDLGSAVAPDFFGWVLPGPGTTRIQLGSAGGIRRRLEAYMELLGVGKNASIVGVHTGTIPLEMRETFTKGRVGLLGDSAGHVKPLSGGGIYPLMVAADVFSKELLGGGFVPESLANYETVVRGGLGKELVRGAILRNAYTRVSDRTISKALKQFSRKDIVEVIEREGDIDHPSALARSLLSKFPAFFTMAPALARDLLTH